MFNRNEATGLPMKGTMEQLQGVEYRNRGPASRNGHNRHRPREATAPHVEALRSFVGINDLDQESCETHERERKVPCDDVMLRHKLQPTRVGNCSSGTQRSLMFAPSTLNSHNTVGHHDPSEEQTSLWMHYAEEFVEGEYLVFTVSHHRWLYVSVVAIILIAFVVNIVTAIESVERPVDIALRWGYVLCFAMSACAMALIAKRGAALVVAAAEAEARFSSPPNDGLSPLRSPIANAVADDPNELYHLDREVLAVVLSDRSVLSLSEQREAVRGNARQFELALMSVFIGSSIYFIWCAFNKDYCFGLVGQQRQFLCRDAITNDGLSILLLPTFSFVFPVRFSLYAPTVVFLEVALHAIRFIPPMNVMTNEAFSTSCIVNGVVMVVCLIATHNTEKRRRSAFEAVIELRVCLVEESLMRYRAASIRAASVPGVVPAMTLLRRFGKKHNLWWCAPNAFVATFGIRRFAAWSSQRAPIDTADVLRRLFDEFDVRLRKFLDDEQCVSLCVKGTRGQSLGDNISVAFHVGPMHSNFQMMSEMDEAHNNNPISCVVAQKCFLWVDQIIRRVNSGVLSPQRMAIAAFSNAHIAPLESAAGALSLAAGVEVGPLGAALSTGLGSLVLSGPAIDRSLTHLRLLTAGPKYATIPIAMCGALKSALTEEGSGDVTMSPRQPTTVADSPSPSEVVASEWLLIDGAEVTVLTYNIPIQEEVAQEEEASTHDGDAISGSGNPLLPPMHCLSPLSSGSCDANESPTNTRTACDGSPVTREQHRGEKSERSDMLRGLQEITSLSASFLVFWSFDNDSTEAEYRRFLTVVDEASNWFTAFFPSISLLLYSGVLVAVLEIYGMTSLQGVPDVSFNISNVSSVPLINGKSPNIVAPLQSPMIWAMISALLAVPMAACDWFALRSTQLLRWRNEDSALLLPSPLWCTVGFFSTNPALIAEVARQVVFVSFCSSFSMTIFSAPEGNALGNGRLVWMFALLALSQIRPRYFGPLVMWLPDLCICAAFFAESFQMVRFHNTSVRNIFIDVAASVGFLAHRLAQDVSLRHQFQNGMFLQRLNEAMTEKYATVEEVLSSAVPCGETAALQLVHRVVAQRSDGNNNRQPHYRNALHPDYSTIVATSTDDGEVLTIEYEPAISSSDVGSTLKLLKATMDSHVDVAAAVEESLSTFQGDLQIIKHTGRFIMIRALKERLKTSEMRCAVLLSAAPLIQQHLSQLQRSIRFRAIFTTGPLVGAVLGLESISLDMYGESVIVGRSLLEATVHSEGCPPLRRSPSLFSNGFVASSRFLRRALIGITVGASRHSKGPLLSSGGLWLDGDDNEEIESENCDTTPQQQSNVLDLVIGDPRAAPHVLVGGGNEQQEEATRRRWKVRLVISRLRHASAKISGCPPVRLVPVVCLPAD